MSASSLGPLEQEVMKIVWQQPTVTVRHVWQELQRHRPIAYTTVMTLMHRLTQKGFLSQCKEGKTHTFTAQHSEHQTLQQLVQRTLASFVERFGDEAVATFVEEAAHFSSSPSSSKRRKTRS